MFSEEIWMELRALHRHGWSIAALAREFNINRRTVSRYVGKDEPVTYGPRACPADLSEHQLAYVRRRLAVCRTIVLTSNRGFAEWGQVFADSVVASAILDRLLHHSTVMNIKGKSFRMRALEGEEVTSML